MLGCRVRRLSFTEEAPVGRMTPSELWWDLPASVTGKSIVIIIALEGTIRDFVQCSHCTMNCLQHVRLTPLSHERLVANAHKLGTSQDSLETIQDGLGCVLARPCMSGQVTETEREIPFFSHRLVAAVDFIFSREIKCSPPPATKMQLNCIGPSWLVPAS